MAESVDYYDILLVGKTGQGKTTLGDKLLNQGSSAEISKCLSTLPELELKSNEENKVRVLDMPGFSSPKDGQTTQERNEEIVRWIGKVQKEFQLKIRRVVYFLPSRGPLAKADGAMQDELRLLYHYFERDFFNCVVVAATNRKSNPQIEFDESDYADTKRVFHRALKQVIEDEDIQCPPIVFVGFNDPPSEALNKIQNAAVLEESIVPEIRNVGLDEDFEMIDMWHPSVGPKYSTIQKVLGTIGHIATVGTVLAYEYWTESEILPWFANNDVVCSECKNPPDTTEGCSVKPKDVSEYSE